MPQQGRIGRVEGRSRHILVYSDDELEAVVMAHVVAQSGQRRSNDSHTARCWFERRWPTARPAVLQ